MYQPCWCCLVSRMHTTSYMPFIRAKATYWKNAAAVRGGRTHCPHPWIRHWWLSYFYALEFGDIHCSSSKTFPHLISNGDVMNGCNVNNLCTEWRTGIRRVWDLPNTTHGDLLHLIRDDLPIYDELCRRSLLFIRKCFFHTSSLVQFVTNYGVFHARHKSLIGSNFHFCVSRFNFCSSLF